MLSIFHPTSAIALKVLLSPALHSYAEISFVIPSALSPCFKAIKKEQYLSLQQWVKLMVFVHVWTRKGRKKDCQIAREEALQEVAWMIRVVDNLINQRSDQQKSSIIQSTNISNRIVKQTETKNKAKSKKNQKAIRQNPKIKKDSSIIMKEKENSQIMRDSIPTQCNQSVQRNNRSRSNSTSRSSQFPIDRQMFLLLHILKPYLSYLQKLISLPFGMPSNESPTSLQAWTALNLLELLSSFTSKFYTIGRYFMEDYGQIAILITQAVHPDVKQAVCVVGSFIKGLQLSKCYQNQKYKDHQKKEVLAILNEMGRLNEKLFQLYLGKYFYEKIQHLDEPHWLIPTSPEFDHFFNEPHSSPEQTRKQSLKSKFKLDIKLTQKLFKSENNSRMQIQKLRKLSVRK